MDKEAIRGELKKVREEIKTLKKEFSMKKKEKEDHFDKGESYSTEINALYDEIKKIEVENNLEAINKDLDERKVVLAELKTKLEELDTKFNEMKKTSRPVTDKPVVKTISAEKARKEVKELELKLQTQVLSLDKESELIKQIQDYKKVLESVTGISSDEEGEEGDDAFKALKRELNSVRRKFNNTEKKIRSLYKQIRIISKDKKQRYKQIDDLRDMKKKSFEEFRTIKKFYTETGKNPKDLFKKEVEMLESLGESPKQKKKTKDVDMKALRKEAEDKLFKKGGVLTTEDLLAFQK